MSYVKLGTRVSLATDKIPVGFSAPSVTPFADAKYKPQFRLEIPKATVETADRSDTLLAIIENSTAGIEKQIEDDLTADFDDTTNDINVWIDFRNIDSNDKPANDNDFYTDSADLYYVDVIAYVKLTVPS